MVAIGLLTSKLVHVLLPKWSVFLYVATEKQPGMKKVENKNNKNKS